MEATMYSAKNRDANFTLPIAKRQVMFSEDAYLEEGGPFYPSTLSKEYLENYLSNMGDFYQITDSYPIVKYYSKNTWPPQSLNRFVNSITVTNATGRLFSFNDNHKLEEEIFEYEVITYITTPEGVNTAVCNDEMCRMLYRKPKLTVTSEGVLIFYTPTALYATLDCGLGNWLEIEELSTAIKNDEISHISHISANKGSTSITFKTRNGKKSTYRLSLTIDLLSTSGVTIEIER